jgi:hypothetical protein
MAETAQRPIETASGWLLRDMLAVEHAHLFRNREIPEGWPFDSTHDFLIRTASAFPHRDLPKGVKWGKQRGCYENAARLVIQHPDRFLYVEGLARGVLIHVAHAWVVDREGYVVDNTWRDEEGDEFVHERLYFGVPFQAEYLKRQLAVTKEYGGLIDVWYGAERWPLQRGLHALPAAIQDLGDWLGQNRDNHARA